MNERVLSAFIIFVGAILFLFRLDVPNELVFDETHYVPAAKAISLLSANVNPEHPLFAKQLIAFGMLLFGDNGFGWRIFGALLSAISLGAVFQIALLLFKDRWCALATAWLVMVDQTFFVQARIAMLDGSAYALLLISLATLFWSSQVERTRQAMLAGLVAGGLFLGLAAGAKWIAGIYAILAMIAWLIVRLVSTVQLKRQISDALLGNSFELWPRLSLLYVALIFGLVSLLVYFLTFWPLPFFERDPVPIFGIPAFQFEMLGKQSAYLKEHPFESDWWSWPIMLEPIWYHFIEVGDQHQAIFYVGNPVIYWGGILSLLACGVAWWRNRSSVTLTLVATYLGSWLIWAVLPKQIGFFFYYNASAILLSFIIVRAIQEWAPKTRRLQTLAGTVTAASLMFLFFYPVLAGVLIDKGVWLRWVWMPSWT